ncbi:putative ribonucleotide reductase small subunit RNR2 [Abalone herpesvirus Victoria/AUS/2009]|uniref:ribonucleoside-diphosphate reductase n=2 Tax=Aurivirus haliotidmalaco1 TaxID=3050290 RepID=K4JV33_ABHV|nr:putative ribonucleotide reductase small subunit RNR2 [Abalone herpesvirus Victoria/AUS/2009]ADL16651.1 RNR2 [Abalone herpesvirus Victoria/AUS/2007]AFU90041.1 putative ribonucleotide reductase small subunit RNR2 [Abalone herpesvirus Victoria/AUS/2009]
MDLLDKVIEMAPGAAMMMLTEFIKENRDDTSVTGKLTEIYEEITKYADHPLYGGEESGKCVGKFDHALSGLPRYPVLADLADKLQANQWKANEIEPSKDLAVWVDLPEPVRKCIKGALTFVAVGDIVVKEAIPMHMSNFPLTECGKFFQEQLINESEHQKLYTKFLTTFAHNKEELETLMHAYTNVEEFAPLKAKVDLINEIYKSGSRAEQVLYQTVMELIGFCSLFSIMLMPTGLKTLIEGNQSVRNDETLHGSFYAALHNIMPDRASPEKVKEIIVKAVEIEIAFAMSIVTEDLEHINPSSMQLHIKATANLCCEFLGVEPIYFDRWTKLPVVSPLSYMNNYETLQKFNFFEVRNMDYSHVWSNPKRVQKDGEVEDLMGLLQGDFIPPIRELEEEEEEEKAETSKPVKKVSKRNKKKGKKNQWKSFDDFTPKEKSKKKEKKKNEKPLPVVSAWVRKNPQEEEKEEHPVEQEVATKVKNIYSDLINLGEILSAEKNEEGIVTQTSSPPPSDSEESDKEEEGKMELDSGCQECFYSYRFGDWMDFASGMRLRKVFEHHPCGHRLCLECVEDSNRRYNPQKCPKCKEDVIYWKLSSPNLFWDMMKEDQMRKESHAIRCKKRAYIRNEGRKERRQRWESQIGDE